MIDQNLQRKFEILETVTFLQWLKANSKKRDEIVKTLARIEAKMIMENINKICDLTTIKNQTIMTE
jgi:hypothetical protein